MNTSSTQKPRSLDHAVLPTVDLAVARHRLTDLGFTVAPAADHPFGTHNACVYFSDGTYLEPLAVRQRETCEAAAQSGNVFLKRDQAFRFRRGEDGFSALVFASKDAKDDHRRFNATGISAGENLSFSRPYVDSNGNRAQAQFELAFAADLRAPDVFFFTCQRVLPLDVDRSVLEVHTNCVLGIREVILSEHNPSDFQYLMQEVTGQREVLAHSFGIELAAANAGISVLNAAGLKGFFGIDGCSHGRGLRLRAIVFATDNLSALKRLLDKASVDYMEIGQRLVVPAATGQGAVFAFEAA
ncbi:MAG: VOC family protein [Alphaproteobacteria bacterium]|nr:VOC family protein [Alphaproteobacteria bacterium]